MALQIRKAKRANWKTRFADMRQQIKQLTSKGYDPTPTLLRWTIAMISVLSDTTSWSDNAGPASRLVWHRH
jgi:hypothetical protein